MPGEKKFLVNEDWTAVILGGLIIVLLIAGIAVPVPAFSWDNGADLTGKILAPGNLVKMVVQFGFVLVMAVLAAIISAKPLKNFLIMFPLVYLLTVLALIITGAKQMRDLNLEAVIFSLAIGLIIGNFFKLPDWFRNVLSTELFVKIGLVLLGTSVIFSDILKSGSKGLIQALVVVLVVWYFAWWICKRLKIDDELSMMISSAVSICGVSAAIATAGAIKGDSKKLSYVISLVLVVAIPMMIFMPMIAEYFNFPQEMAGAWLGGSIDTTGAVVASGTLVGDVALKISTIVKFSQNLLLGVAAFAISLYWTYTRHPMAKEGKPSGKVIWDRFPKFVIGFVAASLLFSFFISPDVAAAVKSPLKNIQVLWFALAFTSIGLETRIADLFNKNSRKPLYAFLAAQFFNVLVTLLIAWLLFG